jgi:hypothetical protein
MITTTIHPNFTDDEKTSTSAKNLTAHMLIRMMTTQNIEIQAAVGT